MSDSKKGKTKITFRRIAAIVCVLLIAGLYAGALIVVCFGNSEQHFAGVLGAMISLPILLWLILWSFSLLKKRREESLPPQNTDKSDDKT